MLVRAQHVCATCARGGQTLLHRYRDFLLDPGTLVTLGSFLLLALATAVDPRGLVGGGGADVHSPLYLAAALLGSVYIWWSALQGIRQRDFTADIPVSLATAAALVIGQYSAAAVVAVLLLLGGMLEEFVAQRAGRALESLASLLPDRVTVRRGGGDVEVSLEEVRVGDVLLVRSGERIAVDGEVASGSAEVSQAAITGESDPVGKRSGDTVYAGTLLEVGALEVLATKVGTETTLGQIRRMVAEAQEQKAPIERILDRYAKLYTPTALLLGGILWWMTGDVLRAITVLIVFCPCVMVLATPTALVAAIGNAALKGSLVKKGATVEALANVDTVAFDKTGTLTTGTARLVRIVPLDGAGEADLLRLAASAEKFSEHPIARTIVRAANERKLEMPDPESFATLPGLGVRARVEGRDLLLGRAELLAEHGFSVGLNVERQIEELARGGRTVVVVARSSTRQVDGPLAHQVDGLFVLEDSLRPEATETVARLKRLGILTVLVTGDNRVTAERIAAELGIDEVHAEVLPQEKVALVQALQAAGRKVAFVGDGVNDGPALAAADVGVAMGLAGTDVAIETAEIALLSDDLARLPHLLLLSRRAVRVIRQNLAFSLGVLALAVFLTVVGILTPVTGALLHELSSIPVIANSARLIAARDESGRQEDR